MPWSLLLRFPTCLLLAGLASLVVQATAAAQQTDSLQQHYVWEQIRSHKTVRLACPRGSLAVGITYFKGRTLDSLHFHCKRPQFANTYFKTWSAAGEIQTVSAGGPGGRDGRHEVLCPEGMAISGLRGVNKNWGGHWLLLSISIECAQITASKPWKIAAKKAKNYRETVLRRVFLRDSGDLDNYNATAPFIIANDPNKSAFNFECPTTPLAEVEVRLAEWQLFQGSYTDVVHGVRWRCF